MTIVNLQATEGLKALNCRKLGMNKEQISDYVDENITDMGAVRAELKDIILKLAQIRQRKRS